MQIIEKNKTNEFIQKYIELAQVVGMEKMEEVFPIEQVMERWKVSYGYDDKKLVADTTQDKIKKENMKKVQEIQSLITQPLNANPQQPTQPMGQPPAPQPT